MADQTLLEHVADIVSAHVSKNQVSASEVAGLIEAVHSSLAALGQAPELAAEIPAPAVSIRASVKAAAITCLDCGAKLQTLKRHLKSEHGLDPAAYRARWNLPARYPLVAPDYADKRRKLAMQIGLGRRPAKSATPKAAQKRAARAKEG